MQQYALAGALGAAGALFVRLFFLSVRSEWPGSYELVATPAQREQRRSIARYLLIRGGPVFVTAVFVLTTAVRAQLSLWTCFWAFVGVELVLSGLRGLFGVLTRQGVPLSRRVELSLYYLSSCFLVVASSLVAVALRESVAGVVPEPAELPAALWTGVFAAVIAISLRRFTGQSSDYERELEAARTDVGPTLLSYARAASSLNDCDPDLIESLILAECSQRPRWFRRLERLKGKFVKPGSYGVAQVSAPAPISDEQSIDELCRRFAGYYPPRSKEGSLRPAPLLARLELHNPDVDFGNNVVRALERQVGYPTSRSVKLARDGRPETTVDSICRKSQRFEVRGTALSTDLTIVIGYRDQGALGVATAPLPASAGREHWISHVPVTAEMLFVSVQEAAGEPQRTAQVDMRYY